MTRKEIVLRLLERLIRERHAEMLRFGTHLTKDKLSAEDLVQEAYCRALTQWRYYDRQYSFAAWCKTITHNLFLDRIRSRKLRLVSLDMPVPCNGDGFMPLGHILPAREFPILDLLVREEEAQSAQHAYSALGPRYTSVVGLIASEGLKYRQVADRLSIPVGTVRSRMYRARLRVRNHLEASEVIT